jgi:endonuclease/exonuclease/phosphatase family metal-dependent hydrolase
MRWLVVLAGLNLLLAVRGPAEQLRVTTWKLNPPPSPGSDSSYLSGVATVIRRINPDVLLLQEVPDRQSCDRLAEFLKPEAYHVLACSAFPENASHRQVAILSKHAAFGAWAEAWKPEGNILSPGGFAFAALRRGSADVCFYSVQFKDNVVDADPDREAQLNILKRELSARQLARHVAAVEGRLRSSNLVVAVAGDFNTNPDQDLFVSENTMRLLEESGFTSGFQNLPLKNRVTRPGSLQDPDATLDYIFVRNPQLPPRPQILSVSPTLSDRFPVTCDLALPSRAPPVAAESPDVPNRSRNGPGLRDLKWTIVGGGALIVLASLGVLFRRSRRKRSPSAPIQTVAVQTHIQVDSGNASVPGLEADSFTSTASASPEQVSLWQKRALAAEHRAHRAVETMRGGLMPHLARVMREGVLRRLLTQRAQMVRRHDAGARAVAELEQRLAVIQSQFQSRVQTYEQRIAELEQEIADREKVTRQLPGSKIELARPSPQSPGADPSESTTGGS